MKYRIITANPVAFESRDHTHPAGTANDNSRNPKFNQKLFAKLPGHLRVMDIGCSGGGFVKDMLDAGHDAVGIEGSDYSLVRKRAEWATIPDNLFTADATKPFNIQYLNEGYDDRNERYSHWEGVAFDVVTAWEVMEHIPEDGLPQMIDNVKKHLATGGVWIMSVSTQRGFHHVTVRDRRWWLELFKSHGLKHLHDWVDYFGNDWIRGPHQNAPDSFHLILTRAEE